MLATKFAEQPYQKELYFWPFSLNLSRKKIKDLTQKNKEVHENITYGSWIRKWCKSASDSLMAKWNSKNLYHRNLVNRTSVNWTDCRPHKSKAKIHFIHPCTQSSQQNCGCLENIFEHLLKEKYTYYWISTTILV